MNKLSSSFKFAEKLILPLLATIIIIDFWETLNKAILALLFIYLLLAVLEKLGIKFRPIERFKISTIGRIFIRLLRSSNPVTQYTEEHLEETSEIIADVIIGGTKQVKKIKEEIKMKKRYESFKLFLKHNKRLVVGYVLAALYILEIKFRLATNAGLPQEALPYIALLIVGFIFYVMGIEGFTFNDINEVREAAIQAKKDAIVAIDKTKKEYDKVDNRLKELEGMFQGNIPAEYVDEWNVLMLKKEKLDLAVDSLKEDLDKAKLLIKTGKTE